MVSACISSIHFHTLVKKPSKPFAQLNNEERFEDQSGLEYKIWIYIGTSKHFCMCMCMFVHIFLVSGMDKHSSYFCYLTLKCTNTYTEPIALMGESGKIPLLIY